MLSRAKMQYTTYSRSLLRRTSRLQTAIKQAIVIPLDGQQELIWSVIYLTIIFLIALRPYAHQNITDPKKSMDVGMPGERMTQPIVQ